MSMDLVTLEKALTTCNSLKVCYSISFVFCIVLVNKTNHASYLVGIQCLFSVMKDKVI